MTNGISGDASPPLNAQEHEFEMSTTTANTNGRVLRLNFACHAELPHGSTLRVTSSSLWACTAGNTSVHNAAHANAHQYDSNYEEGDLLDDVASEQHAIYTSSVDMVTSPDEYPVWRTRTPVVCVVNHVSEEGIFRHRYRYLVVTPGAGIHHDEEDGGEAQGQGQGQGQPQNMTSDDDDGFVHVTVWEDPFLLQTHGDDTRVKQRSLEDLPYRSIDVNISSGEALTGTADVSNRFGDISVHATDSIDVTCHTPDGLRVDYFNNSNDNSFASYKEALELERMEKEMGIDEKRKKSEESLTLGEDIIPDKRLFIVCYHLPVKLTKNEITGEYTAKFSESLIAKTEESSVSKSYPTQWVGTAPLQADDEVERNKIRQVLKPLDCIPLFLDDQTRQSFYYGMCKQVLWPAFHNIDLLDISKSGWGQQHIFDREGHLLAEPVEFESNWDQSRLDGWWNSFCEVNKIFCDAIMSIIGKNDIMWVHDYHLSLLPKFLHEAEVDLYGLRTIQMVFFLHIPFPTSQVFRELERGEFILEGMLHADVVGFHAFDHARHFLNAAKRILGLSHESLVGGLIGVKYRGTKVLVTISNVSIESDVVKRSMQSTSVQNQAAASQAKHEGRSIIGGIDIAQGLSGISLKLLAFERLLADYPNWRHKVTLMQVCLIPYSRKNDEADTLSHVRYLVKRIQNTFGKDAIDYEEVKGSSLPLERRLTLYLASDVFMTTPIREGLNLLPLEYIFAREDGVTITTEFSAVSSVLNGALRVNPYDIPITSTCIDTALSMTMEEKASRRQRDIAFVSSSNSGLWTRRVLADLNDVTVSSAKKREGGSGMAKKNHHRSLTNMDSVQAVSELHMASQPLDKEAVVQAYNAAQSRVIFVDFNGTIVMKEPTGKYLKRTMLGSSGNTPPAETMKALMSLCDDPKNVVYVVSGDTEHNIQHAIGHVEGLGLAAGNGGMIAHPSGRGKKKKWVASDLGVQWDAVKKIVLPILSKYTARANGSFVKLTSSSIGWSYYSCDPEWGSMLSSHLVEELENLLHAFDVRLVTLKGVIEVVPRKLNKGLVVKDVLRRRDLPEFLLCVGDDISDEKMFTAAFSVIAQASAAAGSSSSSGTLKTTNTTRNNDLLNPKHAFTVTVGKKVSNASYFVEDASDVATLLIQLSGNFYASNRAMSWDNHEEGLAMFES